MGEATDKINTANWNEPETTTTQDDDYRIASGSSADYDEDVETEQLRAEIEDTRADMSQTINEIQERLSPDHLMDQVKETVREATIGKVEKVMNKVGETLGEVTEPAREVMTRAGSTIKEAGTSVGYGVWRNPIPIALIGLGVGMLWMRRRRGNGYSYDYDTSQTTTQRTKRQNLSGGQIGQTRYASTGTGTLNQVKESASDLANRSTEALSNLSSKARDGVNTVSTRFGQVLRDNPLAVGAVAVAAGTAVGLALPSTRLENEYIGETSERLVDKAQEVARGAMDKVQDAARQMTQPENNPQQQR